MLPRKLHERLGAPWYDANLRPGGLCEKVDI